MQKPQAHYKLRLLDAIWCELTRVGQVCSAPLLLW